MLATILEDKHLNKRFRQSDYENVNILYVDDRNENLFVLKSILEEYLPKANCYTTTSADEAVKLIKQNDFACILIDFQMPEIDGLALCRLISDMEESTNTSIVMITANTVTSEDKSYALEIGAVDFISKPINNVELIAKIKSMIRLYLVQSDLRNMNENLEVMVQNRTEKIKDLYHSFEQIFNNPVHALAVSDLNNKVVMVSDYLAEILERDKSELIGLPCESLFNVNFSIDDETFDFHQATGTPYTYETTIMTSNGKSLETEVTVTGNRSSENKLIGLVFNIKDISDRKTIETQRETLLSKLSRKNRELEKYVYTVSHDLKSPIITISGFLDLIRKELTSDQSQSLKPWFLRINEAMVKMEGLLTSLLDLAKTENLSTKFTYEDLREILDPILARYGQFENLEVSLKVDEDLPKMYCDPNRMSQVFSNIIENAIKYSTNGSKEVEISASQKDDSLVISVKDNGIGIEPRFKERVFEIFEQLDPTQNGYGIGLSLVKSVVQNHGGDVRIESEGLGHGSNVLITVPMRNMEVST